MKEQSKSYKESQKVNGIKLAPSKTRILKMPLELLIDHYTLIQLKKSSLPSAQRAMVNNRIKFSLEKGRMNQMDLELSYEKITGEKIDKKAKLFYQTQTRDTIYGNKNR